MPTIPHDDLAEIFADEVADVATINAVDINGLFKSQYAELLGVSSYVPVFTAATVDVSAASVARGNLASINAVSYTVEEIQPDGTGVTQLILSKT